MTIRTLGISVLVTLLTGLAGCAAEVMDEGELADELRRAEGLPGDGLDTVDPGDPHLVIPGGGNPCPECNIQYRAAQVSTTTPLTSYRLWLAIPESLRRQTRVELWSQDLGVSGAPLTLLGTVRVSTTAPEQVVGYPDAPAISSTSTARYPARTNYFVDFVCVTEGSACPRSELNQRRYRAWLGEEYLGAESVVLMPGTWFGI